MSTSAKVVASAEGGDPGGPGRSLDLSPSERSLCEEVNRERIDLLARKHTAADLSFEEEQRLEVLTERARHLLPPVLEQDWQPVADISAQLGDIEDRTRRIRAKYRLNE